MSLYYWGNDDGAGPAKYQLLLDGARFADANGFKAVWTPERHFHAFGGPYPNPAVTGAAVAAVTKNLDIRAGSCVLPLHHPARVAEEWAVIDNLSNGRAGIAFASGWMPEDFVLRPQNKPPHNKAALIADLETVRKLWRGERVSFGELGETPIAIITQPRPVQAELPVWITTAGNPDTWREAARAGANVLTHLLGQSIKEVGDKIRLYHETLIEGGRDPADYTVTLMLHTLVGHDREEVRALAREPMKAYLRSATALIRQYASAFPAFKNPGGTAKPLDFDLQSLDPEELDGIIEFAFERYFEDSGLFGTVDDAIARAAELQAIGVGEIACLIDFGIPTDNVLQALVPLAEVVAAVKPQLAAAATPTDFGFASLIAREGVTHLQCTPSMATMLLASDDDRSALASISHVFIGGEALQGNLVASLRAATSASIDNMYGPTETTIWSSTARVDGQPLRVPLGTPIANTQLYILDRSQRPVPIGFAGELFIAGAGVARGYLHNDELTAERFVPDCFGPGGRMYRTGDVVVRHADGEIGFLGRTDHQVKVRGYRIELGEIEARLGQHPGVGEAVVVAREEAPGDVRIIACIRCKGKAVGASQLREHLLAVMPEYMVPSRFVMIDSFPLTPNGKVDRKALPPHALAKTVAAAPVAALRAPAGDVEQTIAAIFKRILGIDSIGANDNFFELGGHSLLAVQAHRELKQTVSSLLSITDLYRNPTVAGLSGQVLGGGREAKQLGRVADRAALRRLALADRQVTRAAMRDGA